MTAIVAAVAACSTGSTASSETDARPSSAPSGGRVRDGPSEVAGSLALPTADPEIDIPSYAYPPSGRAPDLEALLPDAMCGEPTEKLSLSGEAFATAVEPLFIAVLAALGMTPGSGSLAAAGAEISGCSAAIFRVKGADPGRLSGVFISEAAKEGTTFTEKSMGGRIVLAGSDSFQYGYFKGDTFVWFSAPDEASAAEILGTLP